MASAAPLPPKDHNSPPIEVVAQADIRERLAQYRERYDALLSSAGRVHVEDDETAGKASDLIRQIRALETAIDGARKEVKEPFLSAGRTVDAEAKSLTDQLSVARVGVNRKLDTFMAQKRREAEEQRRREEEARRAAEAERLKAIANSDKPAAEAPPPPPPVEEAKPVIRGDYGSAVHVRKVKVFSIPNMRELPDEVLNSPKVVEAAISVARSLINAGVKVPGVVVDEEDKAVVR